MVLPRSMRLKGHRCFDYLYKEGTRYNGSSMLLRVVSSKPNLLKVRHAETESNPLRCAISISNKVSKKAVKRNKLRRFFHFHLTKKLAKNTFKENQWALLSLKPSSYNKSSLELLNEFDHLLEKAGLVT